MSVSEKTNIGHTPGPWEADTDSDHGDYVIWTKQGNFLANIGTGGICFEDHQDRETIAFDVAAANARLIAAAPDLLSAAKATLAVLDELHAKLARHAKPNGFSLDDADHMVNLRAAITKAEGR